ncbi:hypothetical protein RBB50_000061 [Rhinocladiella similis]
MANAMQRHLAGGEWVVYHVAGSAGRTFLVLGSFGLEDIVYPDTQARRERREDATPECMVLSLHVALVKGVENILAPSISVECQSLETAAFSGGGSEHTRALQHMVGFSDWKTKRTGEGMS